MDARRIADLKQVLDTGDRDATDRAARELATIGPDPVFAAHLAPLFCPEAPQDAALAERAALESTLSSTYPRADPAVYFSTLRSPDPRFRELAAEALRVQLGVQDDPWNMRTRRHPELVAWRPEVVTALTGALSDLDDAVCAAAARALEAIAPDAMAPDTVPALALLLADPLETVRRAAASALCRLVPLAVDPPTPDVVETLCTAALSEDPVVQACALGALVGRADLARRAVTVARRLLAHPTIPVRRLAVRRLAQLGPPALSTLLSAVGDDDASVRAEIARALGDIRPPAPATAQTLDALGRDDPSPVVRIAAITALGGMGAAATGHHDALVKTLYGKEAEYHRPALEAVAELGPHVASLSFWVGRFVTSPDRLIRLAAARALGALGTLDTRDLTALTTLMEDPSAPVRVAALEALANLGMSAARALGAITGRTRDPVEFVRAAALATLRALGPAAAPAHRAIAKLGDPDALAALGRAGLEGLGELVPRACEDPAILLAIARLGPTARPLADRLLAKLECRVCWLAADYALTFLDPTLDELVPGAAWQAGHPELGALPPALARFHPGAARLAQTLTTATSPEEQRACTWALGRLGAAAAVALPSLSRRGDWAAAQAVANIVARLDVAEPVHPELTRWLPAARELALPISLARLRAWQLDEPEASTSVLL